MTVPGSADDESRIPTREDVSVRGGTGKRGLPFRLAGARIELEERSCHRGNEERAVLPNGGSLRPSVDLGGPELSSVGRRESHEPILSSCDPKRASAVPADGDHSLADVFTPKEPRRLSVEPGPQAHGAAAVHDERAAGRGQKPISAGEIRRDALLFSEAPFVVGGEEVRGAGHLRGDGRPIRERVAARGCDRVGSQVREPLESEERRVTGGLSSEGRDGAQVDDDQSEEGTSNGRRARRHLRINLPFARRPALDKKSCDPDARSSSISAAYEVLML